MQSGEAVGPFSLNALVRRPTFYDRRSVISWTPAGAARRRRTPPNDPMHIRARKGIGYLPQEPPVFRSPTVEQNILAILETLNNLTAAGTADLPRTAAIELNPTPLAAAGFTRCCRRRCVERSRGRWAGSRRAHPVSDELFAGIELIAGHPDTSPHLERAHRRAYHRPQRAGDARTVTDRVHCQRGHHFFREPLRAWADDEASRYLPGFHNYAKYAPAPGDDPLPATTAIKVVQKSS